MISANLKKAACIIVFVLCPNPISCARAVAFIINNLALFTAKSLFTLLGIFSIVYYKKIYIKLLLIPYIFIKLWLIFLTQSRNTFIAIPLTIVFLYTIVDWKKGIVILLISLCGIVMLFKYNHNIANINRIKSTIGTVEKVKVDIRYTVFKEGIQKAKDNLIIRKGFY